MDKLSNLALFSFLVFLFGLFAFSAKALPLDASSGRYIGVWVTANQVNGYGGIYNMWNEIQTKLSPKVFMFGEDGDWCVFNDEAFKRQRIIDWAAILSELANRDDVYLIIFLGNDWNTTNCEIDESNFLDWTSDIVDGMTYKPTYFMIDTEHTTATCEQFDTWVNLVNSKGTIGGSHKVAGQIFSACQDNYPYIGPHTNCPYPQGCGGLYELTWCDDVASCIGNGAGYFVNDADPYWTDGAVVDVFNNASQTEKIGILVFAVMPNNLDNTEFLDAVNREAQARSYIQSGETTAKVIFSGRLTDVFDSPVQGNVSLLQEGTETVANFTSISNGNYNLQIDPESYDIKYEIPNFYVADYWLKLLSVDISSDTTSILDKLTNYTSDDKISLLLNITDSQIIQSYSPTKPSRILKDGTDMTEYPSLGELNSNFGWFYNESNSVVHVRFNSSLS